MAELIIVILSHTLVPIQHKIDLSLADQPEAQLIRTLDMVRVMKQVTIWMHNSEASRFLVTHASALVSTSAFHCSAAVLANPSAVNFLIAGLKSAEWSTQRECLNGLIRLFRLNAEDDIRALPPTSFANAQKRLPDHLIDILGCYGMFHTETFMMSTTTRDFQGALMQVLYRFGVTLAELITRTEFSIADGLFAAEDPRTGKVDDNFDTGLPFKTYCASGNGTECPS